MFASFSVTKRPMNVLLMNSSISRGCFRWAFACSATRDSVFDSVGSHSSGACSIHRIRNSSRRSKANLTLKNETSVMCGRQLCAPFQPHSSFVSAQSASSCSRKRPQGLTYRTYSRASFSSSSGSFMCANSQSAAAWTLRLPVAASAFSLLRIKRDRTDFPARLAVH